MMPISESVIVIPCAGDSLIGLLAEPAEAPADQRTALIVVVGGPQYRVGSHRQFTQLTRAVAAAGYPTLRFDVRGMGDSEGARRPFDALDDDIAAAIAALQQRLPSLQQFVLWGLCDGASAALMYVQRRRDARVSGLCLLNPWVRSEAGAARTRIRHYYGRRLLEPAFWRKLVAGQVGGGAAREFVLQLRRARTFADAQADDGTFQGCMAQGWSRFAGEILLVLSGNDYTAREFADRAASDPAWRGLLDRPAVTRLDLAAADHTFSAALERKRVESATIAWLQRRSAHRGPACATTTGEPP